MYLKNPRRNGYAYVFSRMDDDLKLAMKQVKENKLSVLMASTKYGVPRRTLREYLGKDQLVITFFDFIHYCVFSFLFVNFESFL